MKLCLNLLFILCFTIFSAQKKESDSTLISKDKNLISETNIKPLNNKKGISNTKTDSKKSIAEQNISIEQEINAVLNYKINRVWRRDLYCFACEIYNSGKVA
jgi:hypothetical protein